MPDTRITRERLKNHWVYSSWKYLLMVVIFVAGWNLTYSVTEYKPPREKRLEMYVLAQAYNDENVRALAAEMGVCRRTICTDIEILTADYPLETSRGNGGCVKVAQWYHPHRNILSGEQQRVLAEIMQTASEQQAQVLREMLLEYGSPKTRQTLQEGFNVQ